MNNLITYLAAVAVGLMFSGAVQAASIIIDDFNNPDSGQILEVTGVGTGGPDTITGLDGVLGEARTMQIEVRNSLGLTSTLIVQPDATGMLSFSNDSGQDAIATVTYDRGGMGLGGVDLTLGGFNPHFQTTILKSDQDLLFIGEITETSAAGGETASFQRSLGPGMTFVNETLSNFVNAGNVDFTQVDRIRLFLNGPLSQDSTLGLIEITTTPLTAIPIPLPGAFVMAMGLGAMIVRRRRSNA